MQTILRRHRRTLFFLYSVVFCVAVLWSVIQYLFTIQTIVVVGSSVRVQVDEKKLVQNLLFLSTESIEQSIRDNSTYFLDVTVRKSFPSTLVLEVTGRTPVAYLTTGRQSYLLDESGYVIAPTSVVDTYPHLVFDTTGAAVAGTVRDPRVTQSLVFLKLFGYRSGISTMTSVDVPFITAKLGNTDILIPQDGNLAEKVQALQLILRQFRMKGDLPRSIDLRFNKPIVRES